MRKRFQKYLLSGVIVSLCPAIAWSGPRLEERMEDLSRRNQAQAELLRELQQKVDSQAEQQNNIGEVGLLQAINDHVELSALLEVEASKSEAYDNEDAGDISLATVEIGLDARISEWSSAHVLLLYEEGEEDEHVVMDEGFITLGNTEQLPVYLTAGKMYVPFGSFQSNMVSDPLPLEIGETGDSAVQIGFEAGGFHGSFYAFNGDINEAGDDDEIDTFGADLGFGMENDTMSMEIGAGWMNNIGSTGGIGDFLADRKVTAPEEIDEHVDGLSLHSIFSAGPFTVIGEYVGALANFTPNELTFKGQGAKPCSYNLEAAYSTEIADKATTFALGYQATDEALDLGVPESRYIGAARINLFPHASLAIEYFLDEDYGTGDGGSGEQARTLTLQLAMEF